MFACAAVGLFALPSRIYCIEPIEASGASPPPIAVMPPTAVCARPRFVVMAWRTRTAQGSPCPKSLKSTIARPTFGTAAWSCASSVPWSDVFRLLIEPLIEPVVSIEKATSACLMFVLNFSTSFFGEGFSL